MSTEQVENNGISEYTTQLADTKPRFDCPIRIVLPVNAPARVPIASSEKFLERNVFSACAVSKSKRNIMNNKSIYSNEAECFSIPHQAELLALHQDAEVLTAMRDYSSVIYSSNRIGKRDIEGGAYVSLGVLYDNQQEYLRAIEQYEKYLEICQSPEFADTMGVVAACNCISVDYMFLASPPSECGSVDGVLKGEKFASYIDKAILYSQRHLDISPDEGGRFVAHSNLGICYGMKGDLIQACKHHQDALRIAIKMQTLYGQSISVGNLGLVSLKKKDFRTAETCFQQHIQLIQSLSDTEAEVKAWISLAKVHHAEGNLQETLNNCENALKIANREGFSNDLRRIHCLIGLVNGEKNIHSYIKSLSE